MFTLSLCLEGTTAVDEKDKPLASSLSHSSPSIQDFTKTCKLDHILRINDLVWSGLPAGTINDLIQVERMEFALLLEDIDAKWQAVTGDWEDAAAEGLEEAWDDDGWEMEGDWDMTGFEDPYGWD